MKISVKWGEGPTLTLCGRVEVKNNSASSAKVVCYLKGYDKYAEYLVHTAK